MRAAIVISIILLALAAVAAAGVGPTQPQDAIPPDRTMIDPSSFPSSGYEVRTLVKTAVIAAPRAEVYRTYTTAEGWQAFFGVEADIELAVGGRFELYFDPEAPEGSRGSEGCQILAYVPDQMVAYSWNAPPKFPVERGQHTWVVVTFADAADGTTSLTVNHVGFGQGGQWDDVYAYFDRAWGLVLDQLAAHHSAP